MRSLAGILLASAAMAALPGVAGAAPEAELWARWQAHDPASTARVDHGAWDRFLRRFVRSDADGVNRVRYAEAGATDREALAAYIRSLGAVEISRHDRDEQLAFWINLYNAVTVAVVLDHYPVDSILDISISPGLFSVGPWKKKLAEVEGEPLSLDDIEHRILRPIWRDPRVHYAVNCASYGCPNLAAEAFTAARTEALLEGGARDFVNHPRGAEIVDGELITSSIYHWFRADFGGDDAGVIEHLRRYAAPPLREALAGRTRVDGHHYDWKLNDASAVDR